jgi:hypothetical protein
MSRISSVAAQLAAPQEGLSSVSKDTSFSAADARLVGYCISSEAVPTLMQSTYSPLSERNAV